MKESIPCVNLYEMARTRRRNWNEKSRNSDLVRRELICHQHSIREYYRDISTKESISLSTRTTRGSAPNAARFNAQPYINPEMRRLIFEFIVCCHSRLYLSTPTLFETFSLLDRYTSRYVVRSSNYQLIALVCLWISSKFFDPKKNIPSLDTLCKLCCSQYRPQDFKNAEFQILRSLDWEVAKTPTLDVLIDLSLFGKSNYLGNDFYNVNDIKNLSIMLCELAQFNIELAYHENPSSLAEVIIDIARKIEELFHARNDSNNPGIENLISDWLRFDRDAEQVLNKLLKCDGNNNNNGGNDSDVIPSCFKLKYSGARLNKFVEFIRCYKREKAMSRHILVNASKQKAQSPGESQDGGCFTDSKSSVMQSPYSSSVSLKRSRDQDTGFYNLPLTPTTPGSMVKRTYSSISTDLDLLGTKRLCR